MQPQSMSSIEKALVILDALAVPPYEYKIQELVDTLHFNRTTVYRILQTLIEHSMVICDSKSGCYKVGPAMYHIGTSYLYNHNYQSRIQDILSEISDLTKESVGMAVREGDKIISIFEIEVHQPMKMNDVPGKYFSVNKGCYGKCITAYQPPEYIERILDGQTFEKTWPNTLTQKEELLAEYARIRQQGYCYSIDELGYDILGVGVPLFDHSGEIKSCVAIAFFREDGWRQKLDHFRNILLSYQKKLEMYLP